ncbi:Moulting cycle MLT-10-like protein family-containing protein [Aphelenchoides fujianensis]|nr:Moulting cycle MLT-10-like protein family-containing protein [Aphelenchoides fujianensis]
MGAPIRFDAKKESKPDELKAQLDALFAPFFANRTFSRLAILSPRLFNAFPESPAAATRDRLLSPSLFGFHDSGNPLSLPALLKYATHDNAETLKWIELLMQMSGAGRELDRFLIRFGPELERVQKDYPRIVRLEAWERRFQSAMRGLSPQQEEEMRKFGYAFMERKQSSRLFRGRSGTPYVHLSPEQRERHWEQRIEDIARLNETDLEELEDLHVRRRRQDPDNGDASHNHGIGFHDEDNLHLLQPFVFGNFLNEMAVFEGLILSPYAFTSELAHPEIGTNSNKKRRIILEAIIAKILSPAALEARIHSSEAIVLLVLSPTFLSPKIASSEAYGVIVLSPRLFSPRFNSSETMMIEVLSPHLGGGSHETSHEEAVDRSEDRAAGRELHSQHGGNADGEHAGVGGGVVVVGDRPARSVPAFNYLH